MGFFNKLLGRKKKTGEEETESAPDLDLDFGPEAKPESEPVKKAKAKSKPQATPDAENEAEPEHAVPTESMSDLSSGSGRGRVREASGTLQTGSGSASLRAMSSGSLRAAPSMIQCDNCERDLPVPLASGITVTCPFCLGRTAYKP